MHELRKDILLGRWIAVLSESLAPSEYPISHTQTDEKSCILCPGRENEIPPEITSKESPDQRSGGSVPSRVLSRFFRWKGI